MEKAKCIKDSSADTVLCRPYTPTFTEDFLCPEAPIRMYTTASQPSRIQIMQIYAISLQKAEFLDYYFLTLKESQ